MILAIRGIMDSDGHIHTWPTAAWDHNDFFAMLPWMADDYRVRFRQWNNEPGAPIDFDPGATAEDMAAVRDYVEAVQGEWQR
jgi:hypothetical protein